jgi:hypothetical protein
MKTKGEMSAISLSLLIMGINIILVESQYINKYINCGNG